VRERRIEDVASVRLCRMGCCGSAERPRRVRIMNERRKEERKNESIWNETERWKDEIIALYLSSPLLSSANMEREGVGKKERKRVSIQSFGTQQPKILSVSKGIPYWVRFGLSFVSLRHSGIFDVWSVLFCFLGCVLA
jgi:hypothetical protein